MCYNEIYLTIREKYDQRRMDRLFLFSTRSDVIGDKNASFKRPWCNI